MLDVASVDASNGRSPISDDERLAPLRPGHTAYVLFTSGSTGRPKGVAVTHRALNTQLDWMQHTLGLNGDDVFLWKTPVTFDASVWELLLPMRLGARLVVAAPDGHADPAYLASVIAEEKATVAQFVPSVLDLVLDEDPGSSLQHVFSGGEVLRATTAERVCDVLGAQIHNLYGPTETTIQVAHRAGSSAVGQSVPVGTPVAGTTLLVLDTRLQPVPVGVRGELYVAGVQVARGYENAAGQTASRFVADPYSTSGTRMYRTGDVVRWTSAGELEYLGRGDQQIKLRGLRIEIGEIETVLQAMATVVAAAVAVVSDRLVGYVVPAAGARVDLESVRQAAAEQLPSYMIPDVVVALDAMPLNTSGKLDRRALPEPEVDAREFRAPATPTEEIVASIFGAVLGVERVGRDDEFFALGGNSLNATRVASRVGAAVDARVPVRLLFELPTVTALAAAVDELAGSGGVIPLEPQPRVGQIPLSLAQTRMWFLNRFDPASAAYNIPMAIRLSGSLDVTALQAAVSDIIARHEVLRTVYPENDGVGVQQILDASEVFLDLAPEAVGADEVVDAVTGVVGAGFDVTIEVPLRARLFEVGESEYVIVLVVHHIAGDGFSTGPMARDVMTAYAARAQGGSPQWSPLPVQYADYTLWQRTMLGTEDDPSSVVSQQVTYWTKTLDGVPDQIDLPADRPRPMVATYRGASHDFRDRPSTRHALNRLAHEHNATTFMVVHAALSVLLARLSGTSDIAIGTPVAGRGHAELDDLIGMFVNTLVLRTDVDGGRSFSEILEQVRDTDLAGFAHADVPFERLVEILDPPRSQARNPLFQVMLAFEHESATAFELDDLSVSALDVGEMPVKFDLQVTMVESAESDGLGVRFHYATDLFDPATIVEFADRFVRLLDEVAAGSQVAVGDLDLLTAPERARVVAAQTGTGQAITTGMLLERFEAQVAQTPNATAVLAGAVELTYTELDDRVNHLARELIARGVGPESNVAVFMSRSVDMLIAVYAVLAAGGAYVPLDPEHPVDRTEYVLQAAAPVLVLTTIGERSTVSDSIPTVLDRRHRPVHACRHRDHRCRPPITVASGEHRLRDLHVRVDRATQGGRGQPFGCGQSDCTGSRIDSGSEPTTQSC